MSCSLLSAIPVSPLVDSNSLSSTLHASTSFFVHPLLILGCGYPLDCKWSSSIISTVGLLTPRWLAFANDSALSSESTTGLYTKSFWGLRCLILPLPVPSSWQILLIVWVNVLKSDKIIPRYSCKLLMKQVSSDINQSMQIKWSNEISSRNEWNSLCGNVASKIRLHAESAPNLLKSRGLVSKKKQWKYDYKTLFMRSISHSKKGFWALGSYGCPVVYCSFLLIWHQCLEWWVWNGGRRAGESSYSKQRLTVRLGLEPLTIKDQKASNLLPRYPHNNYDSNNDKKLITCHISPGLVST